MKIIWSTFLIIIAGSALATEENFVRIGNHEYLISEQKLSWYGAAHYCHSIDADFSNIQSASEMLMLSGYLKNQGKTKDDYYWFDANSLIEPGKFYSLTTGRLMPFIQWVKGEPNNPKDGQNCLCLWKQDTEFEMSDWGCDNLAYFICKRRQTKTTTKDTIIIGSNTFNLIEEQLEARLMQNFQKIGNEFYYFGEQNITFQEALQSCRRRGGNLANIESAAELELIGCSLTIKGQTAMHWIDGIATGRMGSMFSLTTGQRMIYKNFDVSQQVNRDGQDLCAMVGKLTDSYKMYAQKCSENAFFICKASKPEIVNVHCSPDDGDSNTNITPRVFSP